MAPKTLGKGMLLILIEKKKKKNTYVDLKVNSQINIKSIAFCLFSFCFIQIFFITWVFKIFLELKFVNHLNMPFQILISILLVSCWSSAYNFGHETKKNSIIKKSKT